VPGIGVNSAMRIVTARRTASLSFNDLKKLGVVLKRAQYFIICGGKAIGGLNVSQDAALRSLLSEKSLTMVQQNFPQSEQLSLFEQPPLLQSPIQHRRLWENA
jgi:predicted DNA-binding helix-hairpin-helix protein